MKYSKKNERSKREWLEGKTCERCKSDYELTLDHIVPVSFLMQQLGATLEETYSEENFQALCRRCNTLKAGRFDLSDVRTKILLLKYVDKYCR